MKSGLVVPRELANRDIDAAIDYYLSESAAQAALGFVVALEQSLCPYWTPSRHWFPSLRTRVESSRFVRFWRVLHGQRDISARMQEPGTN